MDGYSGPNPEFCDGCGWQPCCCADAAREYWHDALISLGRNLTVAAALQRAFDLGVIEEGRGSELL